MVIWVFWILYRSVSCSFGCLLSVCVVFESSNPLGSGTLANVVNSVFSIKRYYQKRLQTGLHHVTSIIFEGSNPLGLGRFQSYLRFEYPRFGHHSKCYWQKMFSTSIIFKGSNPLGLGRFQSYSRFEYPWARAP